MVLYGGFYKICLKKQDWIMVNPILRSPLYESDTAIFLLQINCVGTIFCRQAETKIDKPNM